MPASRDSTPLAVSPCDPAHPRAQSVVPDLNSDVLEAVCGSIDTIHDLLAMSQTCSLMWGIATREILRTRTIHLTSSKATSSFRTFILNHKATLAHHVRSLVISGSTSYIGATLLSDDSARVMDILGCTVKLDSLNLSFTDKFRAHPARIASVFAGLSALTSLSLVDPGRRWAHYALSALQAPLRTLCVSMERDLELLAQPSVPSSQSFQMILRFSTSSTLTSLRLDQVPMHDNSLYDLPQFRSVRSLAITAPLEREPKLAALLHLFPAMDGALYLRQDFRTRAELFMDPGRFREIQEENRHAQDVFRWARLDRLDCHSEIAGMLALRCPVRRLTINALNLEVIGAVQPRHLVLAPLQLPFYIAPPRPSQAHATAHPYLTHLVVISSFHADDYFGGKISTVFRRSTALRADIAFERLVQTISLFTNVTHVRLVFYCHKEGPCENELESFMRDIRAHAAESAGTQFAPPPHLLAACPQLRYFFVTAAGRDDTPGATPSRRCWCHSRAWRVVDVEPGEGAQLLSGGSSDASATPIVEELRDCTARRVIEAEDLGLPKEWQRKLEACRA